MFLLWCCNWLLKNANVYFLKYYFNVIGRRKTFWVFTHRRCPPPPLHYWCCSSLSDFVHLWSQTEAGWEISMSLFLDSENPATPNNDIWGNPSHVLLTCVKPHYTHARLRTLTRSVNLWRWWREICASLGRYVTKHVATEIKLSVKCIGCW